MAGFRYELGFLFKQTEHLDSESVFGVVQVFLSGYLKAFTGEEIDMQGETRNYPFDEDLMKDTVHWDIYGFDGKGALFSFGCSLETPAEKPSVLLFWDVSSATSQLMEREGESFTMLLANALHEHFPLKCAAFASDPIMEMREVLEKKLQTVVLRLFERF